MEEHQWRLVQIVNENRWPSRCVVKVDTDSTDVWYLIIFHWILTKVTSNLLAVYLNLKLCSKGERRHGKKGQNTPRVLNVMLRLGWFKIFEAFGTMFWFFECLEMFHVWNKTILHPIHCSYGEIISIVSQNTYFRTRDTLFKVSEKNDNHNIGRLPLEPMNEILEFRVHTKYFGFFPDVVNDPYMELINYTYDLLSTDWFRTSRGWM